MAKGTIRFAAGSASEPLSSVWRVVVNKDEVFLGCSKQAMGMIKLSLHKSGVWALAATEQSGATFEKGNRRAKQWKRPLEHVKGVTRGPSILVPYTSTKSRLPLSGENLDKVIWFPGPTSGHTVDFGLYFLDSAARTLWNADHTVLAEAPLSAGKRVVILAVMRPTPHDFQDTVEKLLRDNVFKMKDPTEFRGGSLLWFTQSTDTLRVPLVIDLPVQIHPDVEPSSG